ncbi:MAG: hypothetical protein GEV03_25335 [Streptosporangiales bacterium]|nr:hypothetical protein [Streptosporangiales bacterium]
MSRSISRFGALGAFGTTLAVLAGCTSPDLEGTTPEAKPPEAVVSTLPPAPNVAANPLGAKWTWSRLGSSAAYLRELAGGATWHEAVWCDIEPRRGHRDWRAMDSIVRMTRRLGFTMDLKIRVGACWATEGDPSHVRGVKGKTESRQPRDMDAYIDFVQAAVKRYAPQGVRTFAIENEPNAPVFWDGTLEQLIDMSRAGERAVRSADPGARVASWGMASPVYGVGIVSRLLAQGDDAAALEAYSRYFARRPSGSFPRVSSATELRSVVGSEHFVRTLRYLRAEERLLAEGVFDIRQVHYYEPGENVPALVDYLNATTPEDTPIEFWEVGQYGPGAVSPRPRGVEATKTLSMLLAGGVHRLIWLPLMADPERGPEQRHGLQAPGGGIRPAGKAFRQLVGWSRGRSAKPAAIPGLQGVAFAGGSSTTLVVWSDIGRRLELPRNVEVDARDLTGIPLAWPSSGLRVGSEPVFLRVGAPLPKTRVLLGR